MKTLVIIDDEIFFRKSIYKFLTEQTSYKILGEANNGKSGIDLILQQKPDIAIVDISMPIMNGLEMIQKIYADCQTKFILLTGFADFEYAKQAITLGVKEYLLKPLDYQELTLCLKKISDEIDSEQNHAHFISDYFKVRDVYQNQIKQNFFHKVILGNCQFEELTALQQQIGLKKSQTYLILLLKINSVSEMIWDLNADLSLLHSIIENICTEILSNNNFSLLYIDYSKRYQYLILPSDIILFSTLEKLCKQISKILTETVKISVTFFSGSPHSELSGIRNSYEEALSAMNHYSSIPPESFVLFHQENSTLEPLITTENCKKILYFLRRKDKTSFINYFNQYFDELRKHTFHIRHIWNLTSILLSLLDNFITECGKSEQEYPYVKSAFDSYQNCENINEIYTLLFNVFLSVLDQKDSLSYTEKSSIITEVQEYIQVNYSAPDLRLENIAAHFYISPQYLSTLFSKETGTTLTAYITVFRMEKAKELLLSDSPSIQNTASLCGFTDSGYFSKCFRKQYGISPKNFLSLRKKT